MSARILVVDDSKIIRASIFHAFRRFACEILEAADGGRGLALAEKHKPDLILLDVSMPVMDGTEMLRRLRLDPNLQAIPVIMLTAESARETVVRVVRCGVQAYMVKPFDENQVVERVAQFIDLTPVPAPLLPAKRIDQRLDILLVDDKPAIHVQIGRALTGSNWHVEGQALVPIAWERIQRQPPDILLVSTSLPNQTGFWLLEAVRQSDRTRNVAVLALSVKTATQDHVLAQQLGAAGVITKPIDALALRAKLARLINLDVTSQCFQFQKDFALLTLSSDIVSDADLQSKFAEAVDEGLNTLLVDVRPLRTIDLESIKLLLRIHEYARELSMSVALIASSLAARACANYEESKAWIIGESAESAFGTLTHHRDSLQPISQAHP